MPSFSKPRSARMLCGLVLLALIAACTNKASPMPTSGGTRGYVYNLSMANFAFDTQPDSIASAKPYLTRMNSYGPGKDRKPARGGTITVVILRFDTNDDHKSHVLVVPVAPAQKGSHDLKPLQQAIGVITKRRPEFSAIQPREVTLDQRVAVPVTSGKIEETQNRVRDLQDSLLDTQTYLSKLENAKLQIELAHFFIEAKVRDAAYLSVENAKQLLADLDDSPEVQALSQQLKPLENQLGHSMPYRF